MASAYDAWRKQDALAAVITNDEARRNDYNLSPSRYVQINGGEEVLPLEDAAVLLKEAEEELAKADTYLTGVLRSFRVDGD